MPAGPSAKTSSCLRSAREIAVLRGVAGAHDAAPARLDLAEAVARSRRTRRETACPDRRFPRSRPRRRLRRRAGRAWRARRAVSKHAPRLFARLARAANDDLVAVGVGGDAEPALDAGDVLVVVAEHDRGQAVVVESERDLGRVRLARSALDGARAGLVNVWSWALQTGGLPPHQAMNHGSRDARATIRPISEFGADADDLDARHRADRARVALGVHRLHIGRAADDLTGVAARLVEQRRRAGVRPGARLKACRCASSSAQQLGEPLRLDRVVDLVGELGRRRAGPRRIFERVGRGEADLAHQRERRLEIGVASRRESRR